MTNLLSDWRQTLVAVVAVGAVVVLFGIDIATDYAQGARISHLATELLLMGLALIGLVVLLRRLVAAWERTALLSRDLDAARTEARRWRGEAQELLQGLGEAISQQFERWSLTPAEREVALLLLKGLSFLEAARLRGTSERTVRQQARGVYAKAGLAGRSELAAFFLEDLLLPTDQRE